MDLSCSGARLKGDHLPQLGEDLILTVECIRAFGRIAWTGHDECGVIFDGPLPESDVDRVRQEASAGGGLTVRMKAAFDDWRCGLAR
jgi:hypothetical protein